MANVRSRRVRPMRKRAAAKPTQTERAYHAIKKAILEGEIEEGGFLSEEEIRTRYGIGRTPYREACNRLHHEGLLLVVPRRGYHVPEISFRAACELFEVRIVLEDAIAELAALRATDREIEQLQCLAVRPVPTGGPQDGFAALIQANAEFHLLLARTTRNRRLVELLTQNLEATQRLMYRELRSRRFRQNDFAAMHQCIVDALRTGDPLRLREAVWEDISDAQSSTLILSPARGQSKLVGRHAAGQPEIAGATSGAPGKQRARS
jgi:DNA-binding GntR family transcriptional regulator